MTRLDVDVPHELLVAADSGPAALEQVVGRLGPDLVADAVVRELRSRAGPLTGPGKVRLQLAAPDAAVLVRDIPLGDGEAVRATVSQNLCELVASVYGPGADRPATQSIVWDDQAPAGAYTEVPAVAADVATLLAGTRPDPVGLTELALRFGSDKWGLHYYTAIYDRYLAPARQRPLTVLEIGIGGYGHDGIGGASLRMWQRYFRRGSIFGIDLAPQPVRLPRVTTLAGDQADRDFLDDVVLRTGPLDVVIDDGSHRSRDVLASFDVLFAHLRPGGLYFIEDLQTAYWPRFGGSAEPGHETTTEFLKQLIDALHWEERPAPGTGGGLERNITGIHVHHNLALIEKGTNVEGSLPAWHPARS